MDKLNKEMHKTRNRIYRFFYHMERCKKHEDKIKIAAITTGHIAYLSRLKQIECFYRLPSYPILPSFKRAK